VKVTRVCHLVADSQNIDQNRKQPYFKLCQYAARRQWARTRNNVTEAAPSARGSSCRLQASHRTITSGKARAFLLTRKQTARSSQSQFRARAAAYLRAKRKTAHILKRLIGLSQYRIQSAPPLSPAEQRRATRCMMIVVSRSSQTCRGSSLRSETSHDVRVQHQL
jgi:hypothetical protein